MTEQPREATGRFGAKSGTPPEDTVAKAANLRANLEEILDDVEMNLAYATRNGKSAFTRTSAEYAYGTVAIIRLGVLTESENQTKYAACLGALSDDELRGIRTMRNIAAHAGYAKMKDHLFWNALNTEVPTALAKLRALL